MDVCGKVGKNSRPWLVSLPLVAAPCMFEFMIRNQDAPCKASSLTDSTRGSKSKVRFVAKSSRQGFQLYATIKKCPTQDEKQPDRE